jgi:hypothetical protein
MLLEQEIFVGGGAEHKNMQNAMVGWCPPSANREACTETISDILWHMD